MKKIFIVILAVLSFSMFNLTTTHAFARGGHAGHGFSHSESVHEIKSGNGSTSLDHGNNSNNTHLTIWDILKFIGFIVFAIVIIILAYFVWS